MSESPDSGEMLNRRKARSRDTRQNRGWRKVEEDRGVSPARSRSTIDDRRSSYLKRDLERDAPYRASPVNSAFSEEKKKREREKKKDRKRNESNNGAKGKGIGESTNNNNKQRYRQGLMLILIDRAIHDPDFNFGRCTNSPLSITEGAWIIQTEIIMCARAIIIQVKYNYTRTRGNRDRARGEVDGSWWTTESRAARSINVSRVRKRFVIDKT